MVRARWPENSFRNCAQLMSEEDVARKASRSAQRKAVDRCAHETVFERLCEHDAIVDQRAGESHTGRCGSNAHDAAPALTRPWQDVLNGEMVAVVIAGLRLNA